MRVHVDANLCQGHTLCALAAPAVFLLNDIDGHAYVVAEEVPVELKPLVEKAIAGCPESAIAVTD
jgi:ferredoxin